MIGEMTIKQIANSASNLLGGTQQCLINVCDEENDNKVFTQ